MAAPDLSEAIEKIKSERWISEANICGGIVAAIREGRSVGRFVESEIVSEIEELRIALAEARAEANDWWWDDRSSLRSQYANEIVDEVVGTRYPFPDLLDA